MPNDLNAACRSKWYSTKTWRQKFTPTNLFKAHYFIQAWPFRHQVCIALRTSTAIVRELQLDKLFFTIVLLEIKYTNLQWKPITLKWLLVQNGSLWCAVVQEILENGCAKKVQNRRTDWCVSARLTQIKLINFNKAREHRVFFFQFVHPISTNSNRAIFNHFFFVHLSDTTSSHETAFLLQPQIEKC